MSSSASHENLLFRFEILQANVRVRQYFLETVVKDIYDNIGQTLSLIRVQLSLLQMESDEANKEKLEFSGDLVGKSIANLREMCRLLYHQTEINNVKGFIGAVEREIKTRHPTTTYFFSGGEIANNVSEDRLLVFFAIVLDILGWITEKPMNVLKSIKMRYDGSEIIIKFYLSDESNTGKAHISHDHMTFTRAKLLGGNIKIKKRHHHNRRIKLVIPIN